jgi:hypothetical protein
MVDVGVHMALRSGKCIKTPRNALNRRHPTICLAGRVRGELSEYFGTGLFRRLIGESVVFRPFVNEDLMVEDELGYLTIKQTRWKNVPPGLIHTNKKVGSTQRAKPPFGPFRSGIRPDVLFADESNVIPAIKSEKRASAPSSTYIAVACADRVADACSDLNASTKAGAVNIGHAQNLRLVQLHILNDAIK